MVLMRAFVDEEAPPISDLPPIAPEEKEHAFVDEEAPPISDLPSDMYDEVVRGVARVRRRGVLRNAGRSR